MATAYLSPLDCASLLSKKRKGRRRRGTKAAGAASIAQDATDGVLARASCLGTGQNALVIAVRLNPKNEDAKRALWHLSRDTPDEAATFFDSFAETFDANLERIGYRVPQLVGRALAAHVEAVRAGVPFGTTLDAGCGTGLVGPHLRPLTSGALVGVDLSPKMLEHASQRTHAGTAVYNTLVAQDLVSLQRAHVLKGSSTLPLTEGFELVVAADVLVYFGELTAAFTAFVRLSSATSLLIFTCERPKIGEAVPLGFDKSQDTGRFVHTKSYVVSAAAAAGGYRLLTYREEVLRYEGGEPVDGHLFIFSRGAARIGSGELETGRL